MTRMARDVLCSPAMCDVACSQMLMALKEQNAYCFYTLLQEVRFSTPSFMLVTCSPSVHTPKLHGEKHATKRLYVVATPAFALSQARVHVCVRVYHLIAECPGLLARAVHAYCWRCVSVLGHATA